MKLLIYDQFMKKKSRRLRLEKCNFLIFLKGQKTTEGSTDKNE